MHAPGSDRRRDPAGLVCRGRNWPDRSAGQIGFADRTTPRKASGTLRWDDIDSNGIWTIRAEEREKGHPGTLQLPRLALGIIQAQSTFTGNAHAFAGRGVKPWLVTSKLKRQLDERSGVRGWRFHDLRRTARSLMSRAGVQSEHAERVLGHAIGGVEGIYDRHSYDAEKAAALQKLATLIEQITF